MIHPNTQINNTRRIPAMALLVSALAREATAGSESPRWKEVQRKLKTISGQAWYPEKFSGLFHSGVRGFFRIFSKTVM